jgi:hypothetical protein
VPDPIRLNFICVLESIDVGLVMTTEYCLAVRHPETSNGFDVKTFVAKIPPLAKFRYLAPASKAKA